MNDIFEQKYLEIILEAGDDAETKFKNSKVSSIDCKILATDTKDKELLEKFKKYSIQNISKDEALDDCMDAIGRGLRKYYNAEKLSGNQNQTEKKVEEEDLEAGEKQEEKKETDKSNEKPENNVTATIEQKN